MNGHAPAYERAHKHASGTVARDDRAHRTGTPRCTHTHTRTSKAKPDDGHELVLFLYIFYTFFCWVKEMVEKGGLTHEDYWTTIGTSSRNDRIIRFGHVWFVGLFDDLDLI